MSQRAKADDDEILDWWQDHADGMSVVEIALKYERSPRVVRRVFDELGVPPHWDELTERERRIAEAMGRVMSTPDDLLPERRHVRYASSMEHVKPYARRRVPMSKRERAQDALASGAWRRVVAANMRREGLLPRPRRR